MSTPTITMQPPAGTEAPTMVHLPDATTVKPDANGRITVATKHIAVMIAAGWTVVAS